jgi:iron complex transport system ATP-binding protein
MAPKVKIDKASFAFGQKRIWSDLDLEVPAGQALCLLGPNGCGKTTLLNCIHGVYQPTSGAVSVDGVLVHQFKINALARKIGYVFQDHTAPFPYPVIEVVRMGRAPHLGLFRSPSSQDTEKAEAILDSMGILYLRDKRYTEISGGERQLVLIARSLAQEPEVILLDEPTSHLDLKNQALVLKMITRLVQEGLTVIMTSHFPNHALFFPCLVAMMNKGRFVAVGTASDVMTEDNLLKTYGLPVKIYSVFDSITEEQVRFCVPCLDQGQDRRQLQLLSERKHSVPPY